MYPRLPTDTDRAEIGPPLARLPALDGLRGVAILMVIVYHASPLPSPLPLLTAWSIGASWLWSGVDLFFVLSGFLITRILLTTRSHAGYFSKFYARRTLRIFPLYYGLLAVLLVFVPLMATALGTQGSLSVSEPYQRLFNNQVWLWTYTQNFLQAEGASQLPGLGHLWSLAVEEQFYLAWPAVVWCFAGRRLAIACGVIGITTLLLRLVLLQQGAEPWAIFHWTFTRFDTLAWGALAACVALDARASQTVHQQTRWLIPMLLLGIGACGLASAGWDKLAWTTQGFGFTLFGLLYALIVLEVARPERRSRGWLTVTPLRVLGKYSYAMYVFHWPLCRVAEALCHRIGLPMDGTTADIVVCRLMELAIVITLSLVAAWLSWHLWESPWLRLKRRWAY